MSIISAGNTVTTSLRQTADTSGNLVFTTGSANTVALTLDNNQNATFAGTVSLSNLTSSSNVINAASATGSFIVPTGTSAQRSTVNGSIRYNTTLNVLEAYANGSWITFAGTVPTYTISYLVVAGGGGGGNAVYGVDNGGGGGAGGFLTGTAALSLGTTYAVTVGAGGANTVQGSNSVAVSVTAIGGGYGGTHSVVAGGNGGSGGGGAGAGGTTSGGSGTSGQGNAGGAGSSTYGAGGGGANAAGTGGPSGGTGGPGGNGNASSITGTSVTYAGGGGGGGGSSRAAGGSGGGGQGGGGSGQLPTAGTANTGGGGGGGTGNDASNSGGASGGSGVVIFSIPTTNYSGSTTGSPTVTTSGNNTVLTFTSSGSYTA